MRRADLTAVAQCRADLAAGRARETRLAANITLAEVATSLGVTHQAVAAWETGVHRPTAANALAYAKLLAGLVVPARAG